MDTTAYLALSAALDRELPTALDDARLTIERLRMEKEDLAARAITGRVNWNPYMTDIGSGFTWSRIERVKRDECERWRRAVYRVWDLVESALRELQLFRGVNANVINTRRILEVALPAPATSDEESGEDSDASM